VRLDVFRWRLASFGVGLGVNILKVNGTIGIFRTNEKLVTKSYFLRCGLFLRPHLQLASTQTKWKHPKLWNRKIDMLSCYDEFFAAAHRNWLWINNGAGNRTITVNCCRRHNCLPDFWFLRPEHMKTNSVIGEINIFETVARYHPTFPSAHRSPSSLKDVSPQRSYSKSTIWPESTKKKLRPEVKQTMAIWVR
jgi:hypothetical protein